MFLLFFMQKRSMNARMLYRDGTHKIFTLSLQGFIGHSSPHPYSDPLIHAER